MNSAVTNPHQQVKAAGKQVVKHLAKKVLYVEIQEQNYFKEVQILWSLYRRWDRLSNMLH